jgi:hypothetical protein
VCKRERERDRERETERAECALSGVRGLVAQGDLSAEEAAATRKRLAWKAFQHCASYDSQVYCDEKVANRDIRVWHGATENGP